MIAYWMANLMVFQMFYRVNLILVLSALCLFSVAKGEDGAVDPTAVRANAFIGQKPPEAFERYQRLQEEFTKNLR